MDIRGRDVSDWPPGDFTVEGEGYVVRRPWSCLLRAVVREAEVLGATVVYHVNGLFKQRSDDVSPIELHCDDCGVSKTTQTNFWDPVASSTLTRSFMMVCWLLDQAILTIILYFFRFHSTYQYKNLETRQTDIKNGVGALKIPL